VPRPRAGERARIATNTRTLRDAYRWCVALLERLQAKLPAPPGARPRGGARGGGRGCSGGGACDCAADGAATEVAKLLTLCRKRLEQVRGRAGWESGRRQAALPASSAAFGP
jgi:hypothetical protein